MLQITESLQVPCEGIFWLIDENIISFTDEVNPRDPYSMTDLLHKNVWETISKDYKVNGYEVPYNYFPRGRVEVLVILNSDNILDHYEAYIYMDKHIGSKYLDKIENDFRLYLPNVNVTCSGQMFIDGSHYICHMCGS